MADNVIPMDPSKRAVRTNAEDAVLKVAHGRSLGTVRSRTIKWPELIAKLSEPVIDTITNREFLALSQEEQGQRKRGPFFVGGSFKGTKRKVRELQERSCLTIDCDQTTPAILTAMQMGEGWMGDYEFFLYTTRSHTKAKPRFRLVVPLKSDIDPERLNPVTRLVAHKIDATMNVVDPVSFNAAQVMYHPSINSDGEFVKSHNKGVLLDANALLDEFGDWTDYSKLPRAPREIARTRATRNKAQNPLEKHGWVGAFCRMFTISEAIEKFLPGVYEPSDSWSDTEPRYSFMGGKGRDGMATYEGDVFMFSYHGTDPASQRLMNAFDMVRTHLFSDLDPEPTPDQDPTKLPSYKEMIKLCAETHEVAEEHTNNLYPAIEDSSFETYDDDEPVNEFRQPVLAPAAAEIASAPKEDWAEQLEKTEHGFIKQTFHNLCVLIMNDGRFRGAVSSDQFTGRSVLVRRIRSKSGMYDTGKLRNPEAGDPITDNVINVIRGIINAPPHDDKELGYGLTFKDGDVHSAVNLVAAKNAFHPVRAYIEKCRWDGVPRIRQLWSRYAYTPDTEYHRQTAFCFMVAAVQRVYEPGCKFDFMPVLEGPQGIRKSTMLRVLAGSHTRFGELMSNIADENKVIEALRGKWIVEVSELAGLENKSQDKIKAVISSQAPQTRLAWDRREGDYARQSVFAGTTNHSQYLKDLTGNRRFWPIKLERQIDTDLLEAEVELLWAEAYQEYKALRRKIKNPIIPLPLYLTGEAAPVAIKVQGQRVVETGADVMRGVIESWLNEPVPEPVAKVGYQGDLGDDDVWTDAKLVLRSETCVSDIRRNVFPNEKMDDRFSRAVGQAMSLLPEWSGGTVVKKVNRAGVRVYRRKTL